jgi:hypothetical protein
VELKPSLDAGAYYIIRNIEIDPEQVWINYGREMIGKIEMLAPNSKSSVGYEMKSISAQSAPISAPTGFIISDITSVTVLSLLLSFITLGLVGYLFIKRR